MHIGHFYTRVPAQRSPCGLCVWKAMIQVGLTVKTNTNLVEHS
jgi:hypothetical protein